MHAGANTAPTDPPSPPLHHRQTTVFRNLSYPDLAKHEEANKEGSFVANGTFAVDTGKFTGRSPKDKWIVKQPPSEKNLWWGSVNQPLNAEAFEELYAKCVAHYNTLDRAYVFDGYCGASPASRKKVREHADTRACVCFMSSRHVMPSPCHHTTHSSIHPPTHPLIHVYPCRYAVMTHNRSAL